MAELKTDGSGIVAPLKYGATKLPPFPAPNTIDNNYTNYSKEYRIDLNASVPQFLPTLHFFQIPDFDYKPKYTVPNDRIEANKTRTSFTETTGKFTDTQWRHGYTDGLREVPGKVIYERINDYVADTISGSQYPGGKKNRVTIKFEWAIESQLPPTFLDPIDHFMSTTKSEWAATIVEYGYTSIPFTGWSGLYNSTIKRVAIRIRKIRGKQKPNGAIETSNPFAESGYDEVARIIIPRENLRTPSTGELNDTNLGYDATLRKHILHKNRLTNGQEELKGYTQHLLTIDTEGNVILKNGADEINLNITWVNGFDKFESNSYYYLTLEPIDHPVNRVEGWIAQRQNSDIPAQTIPSDGWYGIEKIFPFHYDNVTGVRAYEGLDTKSTYRGNWRLNKRFTPGLPKDGGWTDADNQTLLPGYGDHPYPTLKPTTILTKLADSSKTWSNNDSLIPSNEFYMYGFNLASVAEDYANKTNSSGVWKNSSTLDTMKKWVTKRDLIDAKAEYFAWFKTPELVAAAPSTVTVPTAKSYNPVVNDNGYNVVVNPADSTGLTYKATIKGKFYYDSIDVYRLSEFSTYEQSFPVLLAKIQTDYVGKVKIPGDIPTSCGFRYRDKPSSAWKTITVISDLKSKISQYTKLIIESIVPDGPAAQSDATIIFDELDGFTIELPEAIPLTSQYEYQIWVKKTSGQIFYSAGSKLEAAADKYPIIIKDANLPGFVGPISNQNGHWYQIYDSWEVVKPTTAAPLLFSPALTVRKFGSAGFPLSASYKDVPVHYYMNLLFTAEKNYQIRAIVDNFYVGMDSSGDFPGECSDKLNSNFRMITPWGESLRTTATSVPFLPSRVDTQGLAVPGSPTKFNIFLNTNINAYIGDKNTPNKPVRSIKSSTNPNNPMTFAASPYFNGSTLAYFGINEIDWFVQGFAPWSVMNQAVGQVPIPSGTQLVPYFDINKQPVAGKGWHYLERERILRWFDRLGPKTNNSSAVTSFEDEIHRNLPIGGDINDYFANKQASVKFLVNNFVATYVPYQNFNLSFKYHNTTDFGITMYLGGQLPYRKSDQDWWITDIDDLIQKGYVKKLARLSNELPSGTTQSCEFVGLVGNQYVFFVADPVINFYDDNTKVVSNNINTGSDAAFSQFKINQNNGYDLNNGNKGYATYSIISLYDFKFAGSYHPDNNEIFDTIGDYTTDPIILGATYSIKLGTGNNVVKGSPNTAVNISGKAGNGSFNSGIWENGVWNSGWREDRTIQEFYTVDQFYSYNKNETWRVKLKGTKTAAAALRVGDSISVSNVVTININEERNLLKGYYTIVDKGTDYIEFEFFNDFMLMRVEIDSDEHRILVSKNIWMNGVFFNGYFKGIWNDGLFSGYPLITKMDESHWIDGIFNGGHFTAKKYSLMLDTVKQEVYQNYPRLAIEFATPHKLTKNDIITITYSVPQQIKSFGTTLVLDVPNETEIVTGIAWTDEINAEVTDLIDGRVYTIVSSGLVQNFQFYSNNVSTVTSIESLSSQRVFSYNSWMDLNYSNQSGINIGRPENYNDQTSGKPYSENNLYGYPTNDVITSKSVFRDSFSTTFRQYKLGKRFNIVSDFVGDASTFEDYFDPTITTDGIKSFNNQGWQFDVAKPATISIQSLTQSIDTNTNLITFYVTGEYANTLSVGDTATVTGPFVTTSFGNFGVLYNWNIKSQTFGVSSVSSDGTLTLITSDIINSGPPAFWDLDTINNTRYSSEPFYIEILSSPGITFSRTNEPNTANTSLVGKELRVETTEKGGVLNVIPAYDVQRRVNTNENATIEKLRYAMVEFELAQVDYFTASSPKYYLDDKFGELPPIHFNNLNVVTRERSFSGVKIIERKPATYLPIYKNVNHLTTLGRKKQEFFFNKRNLLMNFTGTGQFGFYKTDYYLDNLKLYEVDMIPFFQYFRNPINGSGGNINTSVQIPNTTVIFGASPYIDYTSSQSGQSTFIQSYYSQLIIPAIQIPQSINWQKDYNVYNSAFDPISAMYDQNKISTLSTSNVDTSSSSGDTTTSDTTTVDPGTLGGGTIWPGWVDPGGTGWDPNFDPGGYNPNDGLPPGGNPPNPNPNDPNDPFGLNENSAAGSQIFGAGDAGTQFNGGNQQF